MKRLLCGFAMCQSMFCAIPFPGNLWDEKARGQMLLFLPVVGLEIGGIWAVLAWFVRLLRLPDLAAGLVLCACPFVLTGFLHLDGFMDVTDAVKSCRDLEKRRAILKDSHVGSFAVIGLCLLLLTQFALLASAPETADWRILIFIPAVSRCCSALAVKGLPSMTTSQYAAQEKNTAHLWILGGMLAVFLAAGFLLCKQYGFALLGCLIGYGLALRRGYRSLGGMNGDIAGYALTLGEACAVAVYAML
ncbi:MAG: adenosylcobinamide-GDP ribazoletransferase [Firmicutes bacterium]|nr:adenosylcobinamide-GDP ribazoletransferase [Bacillota bacterium]